MRPDRLGRAESVISAELARLIPIMHAWAAIERNDVMVGWHVLPDCCLGSRCSYAAMDACICFSAIEITGVT